MRKIRISSLLLLTAALVAAVSCKKDKDSESTKPSLSGMTFTVAPYARGGETLTVKPYGVVHPEGGTLKYYIKASDGVTVAKPDTVTVKGGLTKPGAVSFSFTVPDSLASYMITCSAIDDKSEYYSSGSSSYVTVVRPYTGGSITGAGIDPLEDRIVDPRTAGDSRERTYYYTAVEGLEWFRNNLAYTGSGAAYRDSDVLSYCFGRYYTYEEALHACPEGWRLPTDAEWAVFGRLATGQSAAKGETLSGAAGALMADVFFNEVKMWEYWPDVKITGQFGLAVLPAGYANKDGDFHAFVGINQYAAFWTSDLSEDGTQALYRYFNVNSPDVFAGYADKNSFAASVRCVR